MDRSRAERQAAEDELPDEDPLMKLSEVLRDERRGSPAGDPFNALMEAMDGQEIAGTVGDDDGGQP